MFLRAARDHQFRFDRSIYIGDDLRDAVAAFNAGCPSILVDPDRDADPGNGVVTSFESLTSMAHIASLHGLLQCPPTEPRTELQHLFSSTEVAAGMAEQVIADPIRH